MRVHLLLLILVLLVALALGVMVFPQVASAWFLNLANASLARTHSLPADSPQRLDALQEADANLARTREIAHAPRQVLAQARASLLRGDTEQALTIFESTGGAPSDAIAEFLWAESAYASNQPETAFAHWRAAGAIEFFMQEAHRAQDAHQWRTAEQMARIAVGIDPALPEAHFVLGDALAWQSNGDPAAPFELDQALALTDDPEFISAVLSRKGELYASQGKLQEALDLFERARQVAPIDARPRTDYATTLLSLSPDARPEALALLKQVTDDSPWYTAAYVALANIAAGDGDLQNAEAWLQKGLARNPNHPGLLVPLADLYVREQRVALARQALVLALKNETRADALQEIANRLEKLDKP
jgi:tetratricopeptide (TPR) repeat protein